jgi:hypothetical protein
MPYEITWIREKRIVCLRVWGLFSEEELLTSGKLMAEALSIGIPPVHVICNASEITDYPKNIRVVKEGAQLYFSHPSMGWFMFLGFDKPIMRFFSNTVMQLLMRNFKHARSMDEVMAILCKVDVTLCGDETPSTTTPPS